MSFGLMDYGGGTRFYSPLLGRFISADTVVPRPDDPQALNRYSYVRNSPLSRVDPTGHCDGNIGGSASCAETYSNQAALPIWNYANADFDQDRNSPKDISDWLTNPNNAATWKNALGTTRCGPNPAECQLTAAILFGAPVVILGVSLLPELIAAGAAIYEELGIGCLASGICFKIATTIQGVSGNTANGGASSSAQQSIEFGEENASRVAHIMQARHAWGA